MATENDLAKQVMLELGVLAAGTNPSAEDATDILTRYHQRLLMLADEDYADWMAADAPSDDVIPDAAMPGLIQCIAYECAAMFDVSKSRLVDEKGMSWKAQGESALRRYMRKKPSYEPVVTEYF